jgi:V8-like Glu-specific endopeptidase
LRGNRKFNEEDIAMNPRDTFFGWAAASLLLLANGGAVNAAPGVTIENDDVQALVPGDAYWTPERISEAKTLLPLRDAEELSTLSRGTSSLDFSRSRITPKWANTAAPYRSAGKLYFTVPGQGDYQCSASVIRSRLIVTAAHCMYTAGIGFHTNWSFIPAFDGTNAAPADRPYGTWNWSRAIIPSGWVSTAGALPNNYDFGILELVDKVTPPSTVVRTVGATVGRLATELNHLRNTHVTMLGYPCNFNSCLILQRNDSSDRRGSGVSGSTAYEYGSDMTGGSSGGPWVENFGDPASAAPTGTWTTRNAVVGVTSYGYTNPDVKILGASEFNSVFSSILTTACGWQAGNCP